MKVTDGKAGDHLPTAARASAIWPLFSCPIPDLQISPGLADQGFRNESRCAILGTVHSPDGITARTCSGSASSTPNARHVGRQRDTRKPRQARCNCTGAKTGTVVRQNPKSGNRLESGSTPKTKTAL